MIKINEELVRDFYQSFVEFHIQSISYLLKILNKDFKIEMFNKTFRLDNNIDVT